MKKRHTSWTAIALATALTSMSLGAAYGCCIPAKFCWRCFSEEGVYVADVDFKTVTVAMFKCEGCGNCWIPLEKTAWKGGRLGCND